MPTTTEGSEGRVAPAVEGLFEDGADGIRLRGCRCSSCGAPYFPSAEVCRNPTCGDSRIVPATFGGQGTLWSFAIERYPPPAPVLRDEPFAPFAVGLVDLDDGLRLLGRVETLALHLLRVDMRVKLVAGKLGRDDQGVERVAWKFAPLVGSAPVGGDQG